MAQFEMPGNGTQREPAELRASVPAPDWPERKKRLLSRSTAEGSGASLSPLTRIDSKVAASREFVDSLVRQVNPEEGCDPLHLTVEVVEKVGVVHEHDVGLVPATPRIGEVVEHAAE